MTGGVQSQVPRGRNPPKAMVCLWGTAHRQVLVAPFCGCSVVERASEVWVVENSVSAKLRGVCLLAGVFVSAVQEGQVK